MIRRTILDTSVLLRQWQHKWKAPVANWTENDASRWANELIRLKKCNSIATPVRLEMIAGTSSSHELRPTLAYLDRFEPADGGDVRADDWTAADRIARRIPRNGKPRQLVDCLIRAIANRLRFSVESYDLSFPQ